MPDIAAILLNGLRDYGTGRWEGGEADCDHKQAHGAQGSTGERADRTYKGQIPYREQCGKCGAVRVDQQIGLERTYREYVCKLVSVFAEVHRVLKPQGVCFLNLGDSFNAHPGQRKTTDKVGEKQETNAGAATTGSRYDETLKPKDLIGTPWRTAFALQEWGWYLRSDIIWCKRNGMPESVKDRPTRAHEYIFLLSKNDRYFYDADAIAEPVAASTPSRYNRGRSDDHKYADGGPGGQTIARTLDHMKQDGHGRRHAGFNEREFSGEPRETRNSRSWWLMSTLPTKELHFATFPITLAEKCVLAGCPEGGVTLDPFAGSGTTGLACLKHGRNFVGIELSAENVAIAKRRARKHYPLLVQEVEG